jgi:hypothetical protein
MAQLTVGRVEARMQGFGWCVGMLEVEKAAKRGIGGRGQ